jgi:sugar porter (SP) family MFS transporter
MVSSNPSNISPSDRPRSDAINYAYLIGICIIPMLGGLLFGYDTGVISGAIEPITVKFGLSDLMKGWVSGCVLIGCALGVILVGSISDSWGRRPAMFLAAAIFLASAIGTALSPGIPWLIAFRLLGGVGIGLASVATPMYIAEIAPARMRGQLVSVNQIAIASGIAATAFVNYAIAHAHGDPTRAETQVWLTESGWRWMFATGIVPAVAFFLALFLIPESPRWLTENGRAGEAARTLAKIGGPTLAASELTEISAVARLHHATWAEVFSPRLRRPLILGIALAVLQQVTGINVFLYFGATIFRHMSAATGVDSGLLQQIVINGASMAFTVIAIALVDRLGRRPLMLVGAAGMGASLVAMGVMAQTFAQPGAASGPMLGAILAYIACFGLSVGPVTWVILAELYPTAVRGRAIGAATLFLWLADYAVTQTFPLLDAKDSWNVRVLNHALPYYIYAGFCAVLIMLVWKAVPETRQRSLEDIEKSWRVT